jgi:hypothetical protein
MEIKATLQKPYDDTQRMDFIVQYNHGMGYVVEETETELQALGYTEEELELLENIRISKLTCTKRVFALMLQELGITYTMLKELIATNEQAQLEWDLCVELQRSNPLLDVMALQLGITTEQLDGLFRYANGEITIEQFRELTPEPNVDNPEAVEEEKPVIDEVITE